MQVDEYKQLKETLNRMPSLRHPEQNRIPAPQPAQAAGVLAEPRVHQAQPAAILAEPHNDDHAHQEDHQDTQSRVIRQSGTAPGVYAA